MIYNDSFLYLQKQLRNRYKLLFAWPILPVKVLDTGHYDFWRNDHILIYSTVCNQLNAWRESVWIWNASTRTLIGIELLLLTTEKRKPGILYWQIIALKSTYLHPGQCQDFRRILAKRRAICSGSAGSGIRRLGISCACRITTPSIRRVPVVLWLAPHKPIQHAYC